VTHEPPERGVGLNVEGRAKPTIPERSLATSVEPPRPPRRLDRVRGLVEAIRNGDDALVEHAVLELSRSRRYLAPLAFFIGAFAMLFTGLRLLFTNWRLMLIEILPAMWIWLAMIDLKAHLLHGRTLVVVRGPILIPLVLLVAAITTLSFFLNAVFAFAIAKPGKAQIRAGFIEARAHLGVVVAWGLSIGAALGISALVFPRWGRWWFAVSMSLVIGAMMLTYVTVPSRMVGLKTTYSKRDKLSATVVGGIVGAVVCTPAYALGRLGILMLGSRSLFVFGVIVLAIGFTLQAGATGAIKAIKMSAKLVAGHGLDRDAAPVSRAATPARGRDASPPPDADRT
jgi:hypothetical protein